MPGAVLSRSDGAMGYAVEFAGSAIAALREFGMTPRAFATPPRTRRRKLAFQTVLVPQLHLVCATDQLAERCCPRFQYPGLVVR